MPRWHVDIICKRAEHLDVSNYPAEPEVPSFGRTWSAPSVEAEGTRKSSRQARA
jgi:hypothetical protein